MQRPSANPTIADLYLAFRQAKSALYFEKRGVGLRELAEYERKLPDNLRKLRGLVASGSWFDRVELGQVWIVPKRLRPVADEGDGIVRIGSARSPNSANAVDIQLRLSPHPAFAIVEVLYLWRFGAQLDGALSQRDVLGYRLDLRNHEVVPHRRWLFEYWPKKYQSFRTAPLAVAAGALKQGQEVVILSGDLASFYDTVEPSFMLGEPLLSDLRHRGLGSTDLTEYKHATESLLRAYNRFHTIASRLTGLPVRIGVPIGALTSRIVANLALLPLDRHIAALPDTLCYRRYVDDLVIVAKANEPDHTQVDTFRRLLPLLSGNDDVLRLDTVALDRAGSEFQLQKSKARVHQLAGVSGLDFVESVASDFAKAVSERRAFVDSSALLSGGLTHLIRAGAPGGPPLRVLRDADRARLERYALSTSLQSLERVSSLINHVEARQMVRESLEQVGRVLEAENNWVADLDLTLRLLKLAICTGDWASAKEMTARMDRVWHSIGALKSATGRLFYRNQEIAPGKTTSWARLRNYLHERRLEAVCCALPIGMDAAQIATRFPGGLMVGTKEVKATALRRRAEQLALADLRARDREEDGLLHARVIDREWLRRDVASDPDLSGRLETIDSFVARCDNRGDGQWLMPAARLYLCTRPPSYFDIARRWLDEVEEVGFHKGIFRTLLNVVNAVRGTEYRDAVATVLNRSTVSIRAFTSSERSGAQVPADPRVILGNLVVDPGAWTGAASRVLGASDGRPLLTKKRLEGLARVLDKASRAAGGNSNAVLILPELSVPRQWFRTVANHVVRSGRYGLVAGLEYLHIASAPHVVNQVVAVLPGPLMSVAPLPWTKRLPAREEEHLLAALPTPVSFRPATAKQQRRRRTVVRSPWGNISVLICSEMIEARRVADLLGRVNVVLCPAWNQDTSSYDHLIQSIGFELHSIIAIANNGHYSDCRAWAPRTERWQRDLCRLIERDVDDVVHVDLPLASLVAFQNGQRQAKDQYATLRNALSNRNISAAVQALRELTDALPGAWRPLPPDWS